MTVTHQYDEVVEPALLVIVDADTLAGWRRASSSLAQLNEAVEHLRRQVADVAVAVVADPSLKWALSPDEQVLIEHEIVSRRLVCSPAGCQGGHLGFLARVVEQAERVGFAPVVLTDQVIPGVQVGRVRRDGDRWVFDLEGRELTAVAPSRPGHRRRRTKPAA